MAKRFKSKKRHKKKFKKYVVLSILFVLLYEIVRSLIVDVQLSSNNQEFLKTILKDSNHHVVYEKPKTNFLNNLLQMVQHIHISDPFGILENTFGYKIERTELTSSDNIEDNNTSNYIEDPNPVDIKNPRVYLYNTHQTESYAYQKHEDYNITPNVMMASYILREKLNNLGIATVTETGNIKDFLNANGWNYASSYKASRYYLEEALKKYNNLDLIIDIHRDSLKKSSSTVEIDGKSYAKVLFVIGTEHKNYEQNLKTVQKINQILEKKYPTLTRGIMKKSGANVNGIYNQDKKGNIILMECGGNQNTIEEVMNTLEVMSKVIEEYLKS